MIGSVGRCKMINNLYLQTMSNQRIKNIPQWPLQIEIRLMAYFQIDLTHSTEILGTPLVYKM